MLLSKYTHLIVRGIPKRFNVTGVLDVAFQEEDVDDPLDHEYDQLFLEPLQGDDAVVAYKYFASATGVYVTYFRDECFLLFELSVWGSDADAELFAALINTMLKKHRRARLYKGQQQLECLTEEDIRRMQEYRRKYVERLLAGRKPFVMEGIWDDLEVNPACPMPAPVLAAQVSLLRQNFVDLQWRDRRK